ncbi:hypothetical protein STEG23_020106 [Scotinomys teguina]
MRANVQAKHHQMAAEAAAPYITRTSRTAAVPYIGALHRADITQSARQRPTSRGHHAESVAAAPYIARTSRRARGSALHHVDITWTSRRERGSGALHHTDITQCPTAAAPYRGVNIRCEETGAHPLFSQRIR